MQATSYWAHSGDRLGPDKDLDHWQLLAEHLEAVADLAARLAALARPNDAYFAEEARLAGFLHDFGKYSDAFQKMLTTGKGKCQHAIHGAIAAIGKLGPPLFPLAALAIAGHHAGIPDFNGSSSSLAQKLKQEKFCAEAVALRGRAVADSSELRAIFDRLGRNAGRKRITPSGMDLYTRMLFSCLVDADRLDTAGRAIVQAPLEPESRMRFLLDHLNRLGSQSPEGIVKAVRAQVLEDCLQMADSPGSLFSLSVPTGGGKTLAALAFALQRAGLSPDRFRRIIIVIPYLSIIEQNARVYASVFGSEAVLEHHSGSTMPLVPKKDGEESSFVPGDDSQDEDEQRRGHRAETENWDAPMIVTTSTRFFESLFSNRPKDLRRAHNIARSIIILDEVQTLPRRLLSPLLAMQKELAEQWGVNFVFATATQPAFEQRAARRSECLWPPGTIREIIRNPEPIRNAMVRAKIAWEIDTPVSWQQVAARAMECRQCLVIVNLRDHASTLFVELLKAAQERGEQTDGIFHLSTRMCAAHRLRVLDRIREILANGERCRVVSTQLIEAGVDVDFPTVLRAIGPLDSIIQAAGRADREGRLTAELKRPGGEVIVFLPKDKRMPPHEYKEAAGIAKALAAKAKIDGGSIQVDSVAALEAYFERYYNPGDETALGSKINEYRSELKFATLAEEFEYINSRTKDVFVPDDDEARAALENLRRIGQLTWELRRRLQRHTVGLNPSEFVKAKGVLTELRSGTDIWIAEDQAYDERLGLIFEPEPERYVV